jgi:hypothetical protein
MDKMDLRFHHVDRKRPISVMKLVAALRLRHHQYDTCASFGTGMPAFMP